MIFLVIEIRAFRRTLHKATYRKAYRPDIATCPARFTGTLRALFDYQRSEDFRSARRYPRRTQETNIQVKSGTVNGFWAHLAKGARPSIRFVARSWHWRGASVATGRKQGARVTWPDAASGFRERAQRNERRQERGRSPNGYSDALPSYSKSFASTRPMTSVAQIRTPASRSMRAVCKMGMA